VACQERQYSAKNGNSYIQPGHISAKMMCKSFHLPFSRRKCLVQCCTHPDFFSRGIPHRCKAGFQKIWLCASLQRPFFRKFWQGNLSDCHFYRNFGFTNIRIAFFTEIPALQTLHMPVFFFQRHSASLQSGIFQNPAVRIFATAFFPEILAGKSFGLPFLQDEA